MTFVKGKSGNPNGRPKGSISITSMVKDKLICMPPGEDKHSYADKLIEVILDKAIKEKDVPMIKVLWSYMDGLPVQSTELTGKGGESLFPKPILGGESK